MKKLFISTVLASTAFTSVVFADTESLFVPSSPSISNVSSVKENKEEVRMVKGKEHIIKKRANTLINQRVKELELNNKALQKNKNLTNDQKSMFSSEIAGNITKLSALAPMIATSTDATTTKALIESIFSDFRIFGIVIPKIRLETRIYQLKNHANTLSETFVKLQGKIDEQKAKGHDVTSWQKGLDDAKMLVAQDMYMLDELLKKTATLTPLTYGTTSKAIIDSTNQEIKSITKDFNTVVSKVRKPARLPKMIMTATSTLVGNNGTSTEGVHKATSTTVSTGTTTP